MLFAPISDHGWHTYEAFTVLDRGFAISKFIEKYLATTLTVISLVSFWLWGLEFYSYGKIANWQIPSLYAAIFDTASILCAFLFSFLVFVKTTTNGFLEKFRKHAAYKNLLIDFKKSIFSSFFLTIITIPCLVVVPVPTLKMSATFYFLMAWFALCFYVLGSVIRSCYQFLSVLDAAYSPRFDAVDEQKK